MSAIRLQGWTSLVALVVALLSWDGGPPKEPQSAKASVDLYGDPLPQGAIARLGSVRFRHPAGVYVVAFSPDGKLIATVTLIKKTIVIWDRATGRKISEIQVSTPLNAGQGLYLLSFSLDGKKLYGSVSYDDRNRKLFAWDVATGADAPDVPPLPSGTRALGFSLDTKEVILLEQREIVSWDIEKGKERGRYRRPGADFLTIAARVGERVLVPSFDGQAVGMWDATQNKQLWSVKTMLDQVNPGFPMGFSADGCLFAVEAPPKEISVYESVSGKLVRQLKGNDPQTYYWVRISPDGRTVAAVTTKHSLQLWDVESGQERRKPPPKGTGMYLYFAPDSKTFATAPSGALQLWETSTGKRVDLFPGHTGPLALVLFSPDGRTVATCSRDGSSALRLWDAQTGRLLRSFDFPNSYNFPAITFSPDGRTLAECALANQEELGIWDARTGLQRHVLARHKAMYPCQAFSFDGKRLVSGDKYQNRMGEENRLLIWDAESGKRLCEIRGTPGIIHQVLFSHDGRHILVAADGVHVYDADSGRLVGEPFPVKKEIRRMALSADGRLLATAYRDSRDGPVRLWELATRREIALANLNVKGEGVALTPDGRTLAISDSNGKVVLCSWPSGEKISKLSSETNLGDQVYFSADGRRLATAGNYEFTALIWDVASMVNRPLPAVVKPTEEELRLWWEALRDDNPTEAYKAVWRFAAVPEQALPFLATTLRPVKPSKPVDVARLIDDLDSDEFRVREKASRELGQLGDTVEGALRKTRKGNISVEQARRIDELLAKLANPMPDSEQLRPTRAIAVLEQIGGPNARKILADLAAGAAEARLTQEAQAALERSKKRK